jgi:hypothetical protein
VHIRLRITPYKSNRIARCHIAQNYISAFWMNLQTVVCVLMGRGDFERQFEININWKAMGSMSCSESDKLP